MLRRGESDPGSPDPRGRPAPARRGGALGARLRAALPLCAAVPPVAVLVIGVRADPAAAGAPQRAAELAPRRPRRRQPTAPATPRPPSAPLTQPQQPPRRPQAPAQRRDAGGGSTAQHRLKRELEKEVLLHWGPDAAVLWGNDSGGGGGLPCFRFRPPASEPRYGLHSAEVLSAYHRRRRLNETLGEWLAAGALEATETRATPEPEQGDQEPVLDRDEWWRSVLRHRPGARRPLQLPAAACAGWRAARGCRGDGPPDPAGDRGCEAQLGPEQAGYCACGNLRLYKACGWGPLRCADACAAPNEHPQELWSQPRAPSRARHYAPQRLPALRGGAAARAAVVTLTHNLRLGVLLRTLKSFESHVHRRHGPYPYLLFSDEGFSGRFRAKARAALCGRDVRFHAVPPQHWGVPEWIDQERLQRHLAAVRRNATLSTIPHMGSLAYRKMCRWYAGFFARHPALQDYDYFWRVDDDVRYLCDVPVDPVRLAAERGLVYGFAAAVTELMETVPGLMRAVLRHAALSGNGSTGWLFPTFASPGAGPGFTGCHFWNNFAVGDLRFFRSPRYVAYFDALDRAGGFFFERWGDAPVQTLGVALLAPVSRVAFLEFVAYGHDQFYHIPEDPAVCAGAGAPSRAARRSLEGGHLHWSCAAAVADALAG